MQRSGERIRVNVTLIDATLDRQLWASSYERSASDVFAVESEVARDVATVLQARLTAEERKRIAEPPTTVPAAYDFYLRAKAFAERTTRTEAEIHEAVAAYEGAVRLDPDFAIGWAQLSRRHANLPWATTGRLSAVARRNAHSIARLRCVPISSRSRGHAATSCSSSKAISEGPRVCFGRWKRRTRRVRTRRRVLRKF